AAWWPGNGASDDLVNGYHALLGSGTTYTNGKVASAFIFNGLNNYVWMPAQSNYDVGSGAAGFTLEFWMNPNSLQNASVLGWANGVRVDRTTSGSAAGDTLRFFVTGTNSGQFLLAQRPWATAATLNQWYHIALTYDRVSGQAKAYTNGVLLATSTVGSNVMSTAGDFYLGQVPGSPGFFSGALDEISIYKRPLSPDEVYSVFTSGSAGKCPEDNNQAPVVYAGPDQTLPSTNSVATLSGFVSNDNLPTGSTPRIQWSQVGGPGVVSFNNSNSAATTATFSTNGVYVLQLAADDSEVRSTSTMQVRVGVPCTVSDPTGLVAFWPGNGTSDDVISRYHAQLGSGTTYTNGKVASAFSFNGVNNFVWMPAQTNYDVGSSATGFSLEFWMNPNSFQNANVLGWNNGVRVDRVTSGSAAGDTLRFVLGGTNSGQFVLGARPWATSATLNQWYHIALTYDRASGQAKVYTNGVLLATGAVGSNVLSTAGDFYLGNVPSAAGFFSGGLDEISLYNRPLALSEIQGIFSTGISGKCITVPNRPPFVFAGGNRTINLPTNSVTLFGAVYDDGKPGNALSVAWNYVSGPATVFFSSFTNPVTTITFTNTGVYTFQLSASDGQYISNDTAVITVLPDPRTPPTVAITGLGNGTTFEVPSSSSTANVVVTAAASDKDGVVSRVDLFEDNSLLATLTVPPYTMIVSNVPVGSHTFTAVATDNDGLATTSAPVSIIVYVDSAPVATIFTPAEAATISELTAIIGTASSPILQSYQLLYRFKLPVETQPYPWTVCVTSNSSVVSNIVAVFDPSLLLNGIYEIQLSTTDTKGRTASSEVQTLILSQDVNLTNFMLSFSDLTISTPGLPIQITRTYDSRDHRTNDFGIGWSLDIRNVCLQKSRNLATNWFSSFHNSLYSLDAVQPHRIMITMAGNKTFEFEAGLNPSKQIAPIAATRMTFTNLPGTDGTLEIDGDNRVNVSAVGGTLGYIDLIDFSTSEFFNPTRFKFTTAEGNVYIIDEKQGVKAVTDTNSNTLTITPNGISHSSGVSVTFTPDNLGRLTTITDPIGNQLQYGYGSNGSLATFTDFATNTTSFGYTNASFPNLLTEITDTNGVHAVTLTPTGQ
ncbi:MAG: LamG-like jellyroll fold domain-containing protein, partial [Limisphaerales bacterium]